eukprot:111134_1
MKKRIKNNNDINRGLKRIESAVRDMHCDLRKPPPFANGLIPKIDERIVSHLNSILSKASKIINKVQQKRAQCMVQQAKYSRIINDTTLELVTQGAMNKYACWQSYSPNTFKLPHPIHDTSVAKQLAKLNLDQNVARLNVVVKELKLAKAAYDNDLKSMIQEAINEYKSFIVRQNNPSNLSADPYSIDDILDSIDDQYIKAKKVIASNEVINQQILLFTQLIGKNNRKIIVSLSKKHHINIYSEAEVSSTYRIHGRRKPQLPVGHLSKKKAKQYQRKFNTKSKIKHNQDLINMVPSYEPIRARDDEPDDVDMSDKSNPNHPNRALAVKHGASSNHNKKKGQQHRQ